MMSKHTFKTAGMVILFAALCFAMAACSPDPLYIRVAFIEGVPETGVAGSPLLLTAKVRPVFARNSDIIWLVRDAGTTGASISGNILNTQASGVASIRAIIINGIAEGMNYTQDFFIVFSNGEVTPITSVAITVTAPAKNAAPDTAASDTDGGHYTAGAVSWLPADNPFRGVTAYTATVTLTAHTGYTFTGLTAASVNGNSAVIIDNNGSTATVSYTFPPTSDRALTGITITSQPIELTWTEGDAIDLSGLEVTLTYEDSLTETAGIADFAAKGITAHPAQGMELTMAHNGLPVTVSAGGLTAFTNNLTVIARTTTVPVTGVTIDPSPLTLFVGHTGNLAADITPAHASNKTVIWSSGNTSVATVSGNGEVTAHAAGIADITVTTTDGGFTATCTVTVQHPTDKDARIGTKYYDTLDDALANAVGGAANNPTEIVVLRDITATSGYTIPANKHIKLTVEPNQTRVITASPGGFSLFTIDNANSSLTLEGNDSGSLTLRGMGDPSDPTATAASNRRGVNVKNGSFTMNDLVDITGFYNSSSNGGGVYVGESGIFTMSGGTIANNYASSNNSSGGGVYVDQNRKFTMFGGIIANNYATFGGGVHISEYGTFEMNGGEIKENSVTNSGGGVYISRYGTFTMEYSRISKNTASGNSGNGDGGGVYVVGGTFTMSDSKIENNNAFRGCGVYISSSGNNAVGTFTMNDYAKIIDNTTIAPPSTGSTSVNGGGVYVVGASTIFTMKSGEISGNTVRNYGNPDPNSSNGGGVYVSSGTFNMSGGDIKSNTAANQGGGVYLNSGTFTMSGGTIYGINSEDTNKAPGGDASDNGAALYKAGGTAQHSNGNDILNASTSTLMTNDTLTGQ